MAGLLLAAILVLLAHRPATAASQDEVLSRTLPAYGLAVASLTEEPLSSCRQELRTFRRAVEDRVLWALKMLDASGEPRPGFVYGNNYWLGSRSQCLDVGNRRPIVLRRDVMANNSRLRDARTEFPPYGLGYFVAHFRHNSTLQYHVRLPNEDLVSLGLCLPASCTTSEIGLILSAMFREKSLIIGELYSADFQLVQVRDLKDDHEWLFTKQYVVFNFIVLSIISLMVLGTAYDVMVHRRRFKLKKDPETCENNNEMSKLNDNFEVVLIKNKTMPGCLGKLLLCFSVYSNTELIFSTKLSGDSIEPIHGLRFLGMFWIIMIHTVYYMSDYADNKTWSWRMSEGFAMQIVSNSTFSVDTFFFLSGFLVAYMYLNAHKNSRKKLTWSRGLVEFFVTVVRRFMRLTPAYMMMVWFLQLNMTWSEKTTQFYMTERPHETCQKYWWRNLLYINNLFGRQTMCMSWSWYLSNDMQFFIIAELLLILSSICFSAAAAILLFLLLGSVFITGYIAYVNDYVPTMDQQFHMLDLLYDPPWTRIGPYIIGIMTAFTIVRLNKKLRLQTRTVALGWVFSSVCNLGVLFGLYEKQLPVFASAVYVALSRTVWAVGLAWLLIACCTNHGGIANKILCFKAWIPLSRLTYCAYLLNPFLINSIYLHSESAVHVDFLPNVTMFMGNLTVTYCCSYVLSLMLETPTILIMRTIINVRKR